MTVEPTADTPQRNGTPAAVWPAWAVPARAVAAWVELQRGVRELGGPPACERDPEAWWLTGRLTADGRERAAAAIEACSSCPVRTLCGAYAVAAGERHGVWGGLTPADRVPSPEEVERDGRA